MSRFFSGVRKGLPRYSFGEAGFSQVVLLVLLVVGLVAGVYGVQYARTVMNPQASELTNTEDATQDLGACEEGTVTEYCSNGQVMRLKNVLKTSFSDEQDAEVTECVRVEEETGLGCSAYFCSDDGQEFCDPNAFKTGESKIIRKVVKGYKGNACVYDWIDTGRYCGGSDTRDISFESGFNNTGTYCKPGTFNPSTCTLCNASGSDYNPVGTDWGNYSVKPEIWCSCAKQYSQSLKETEYTRDNYPGCSDAPRVGYDEEGGRVLYNDADVQPKPSPSPRPADWYGWFN